MMLEQTYIDMLRDRAALNKAWAEIERLRKELDAMRRTAGDLADEKGHIATELLQMQLKFDTALHNATYMTAKVAEIDTERLALLDELAAAQAIIEGMRRAKNS